MKRIIVACDSFKGCLTSQEIAATVAAAITAIDTTTTVKTVVMADGGEGTVEALVSADSAPVTWADCNVDAPLRALPQVTSSYAVAANGEAYMELASAAGITLIPPIQRNVMQASTQGVGQMILDAVERGCRHIVMGLGGSATCDGAMGLLAVLGVEFVDARGHLLEPCAANLEKIHEIDCSGISPAVLHTRFTLLTDVDNPLCGTRGAARVFAPQKGASPQQVERLERGMMHYAGFLSANAQLDGAGAAGGVAAGMMAFLPQCKIKAGAQYIIERAHLAQRLRNAALVITGEGRIDCQTAMGKAPQAIAAAAHSAGVPVVAMCGAVDGKVDTAAMGFDAILAVTPAEMPLEQAMKPLVARENIAKAITHFFSLE